MNEPLHLQIARRDIGLREIKGAATAPRIQKMLIRLGAWWRDDETPWCGVAVGDWMTQAGHVIPKAYYRALAWAEWGVPLASPALGCVAVLTRDKGGHVGLVTGVTASGTHVRLLGGNQGDAVSEAWFPVSRIVAWRNPPTRDLAESAPVAALGALSASEA